MVLLNKFIIVFVHALQIYNKKDNYYYKNSFFIFINEKYNYVGNNSI